MLDPIEAFCNPEILEKLREQLRKYSFSSKMEMCRKIAHLIDNNFPAEETNATMFADSKPSEIVLLKNQVHLHEIDHIALLSLVDVEDPINNELNNIVQFIPIINLSRDYVPPFIHQHDIENDSLTNDHFLSFFATRTALQQFEYQQHFLSNLYRYQWFFSFESQKNNVSKLFREQFHFSFDEYFLFFFLLFLISRENSKIITLQKVVDGVVGDTGGKISAQAICVMLNQLCEPRSVIQKNYSQLKSCDKRMLVYDFNPLQVSPIIINGDDLFVPIPQLLFRTITKGFYHKLCDIYKEMSFRQWFGKEVFEAYVGHVLSWEKVDYTIIPEFTYGHIKKEKKSSDFILVRENDLILVEVKGTTPISGLGGADLKKYSSQVNKAYSEAVAQCARKEYEIRSGVLIHSQFPSNINKIWYLVITLEEFNIFSTQTSLDFIRSFVKNKGIEMAESKTFEMMSINTLEAIAESDSRSLFDFIEERDSAGRTFTIAPFQDINRTKEKIQTRSLQYINDIIDKLKNLHKE